MQRKTTKTEGLGTHQKSKFLNSIYKISSTLYIFLVILLHTKNAVFWKKSLKRKSYTYHENPLLNPVKEKKNTLYLPISNAYPHTYLKKEEKMTEDIEEKQILKQKNIKN